MKKKYILILVLHLFILHSSLAQNKVNILTWWGYLDDIKIQEYIKKKCSVDLSYDTYYSNEEMLRRWDFNRNNIYDVIIFSNTIYNFISASIYLNKSNVWKASYKYHPKVRSQYLKMKLPKNIAFFSHSLTGFIWNPRNLDLNQNDTIFSIFNKANQFKVVLIDDPVEINMLLNAAYDHKSNTHKLQLIKQLLGNSHVFIGNDINNLYHDKNFAISYQWSGSALTSNKLINDYKFLVNSKLSYITTDLLAQTKDNVGAKCVAETLASKEFSFLMQDKNKYFSPYCDFQNLSEGSFKNLYRAFVSNITKFNWLVSPNKMEVISLENEWNRIKYELLKK